jgi:hypothetical protein
MSTQNRRAQLFFAEPFCPAMPRKIAARLGKKPNYQEGL